MDCRIHVLCSSVAVATDQGSGKRTFEGMI